MLAVGAFVAATAKKDPQDLSQAQMPSQNRQVPKDITSQELNSLLAAKDFFLVNVHVPYEGELPKTDSFIAYSRIGVNLDKLPTDKNSKIVLYCKSGRMSEIAAQRLASLGYTNVYNQIGGMIDWEKQGFQLIRK